MTSPTQQIAAARAGDPGALDSLFGRAMPRLIAFLRVRMGARVGARESVRDLAQSVCREVLEDLDDLDHAGEDAFAHWLFLQASRKVVDRARYLARGCRDVAREVEVPDDPEALLDCYASLCSPSLAASGREEVARIEAAIRRLPDNQREAVALSRIMALPYPEVAARLDCTEAAARGLVARGLARLAVLIERP